MFIPYIVYRIIGVPGVICLVLFGSITLFLLFFGSASFWAAFGIGRESRAFAQSCLIKCFCFFLALLVFTDVLLWLTVGSEHTSGIAATALILACAFLFITVVYAIGLNVKEALDADPTTSIGRQIVNWSGNAAVKGAIDTETSTIPLPTGRGVLTRHKNGIRLSTSLYAPILDIHHSVISRIGILPSSKSKIGSGATLVVYFKHVDSDTLAILAIFTSNERTGNAFCQAVISNL